MIILLPVAVLAVLTNPSFQGRDELIKPRKSDFLICVSSVFYSKH